MIKKPSLFHRNRQWHNWLIYNLNDYYLSKYSACYQGTMIDLGCGESPYQAYFMQFIERYIGVDWEGSNHITKETVLADLNKLIPLDNEAADTVVSFSVIEHLYNPQQMLDEAYRILKPNGNIVLQSPWQWWIHEAPHDYFRYSPFALKYMFEQAGFKDITITAQAGFFTTCILKFNYFSTRFIRGPKAVRKLIKICLVPFWTLGQIAAPLLDKLDKNWPAETIGFFVTAKKEE